MNTTRKLTGCFLIALVGVAAPALAQVVDKGWFCASDKMSGTCEGKAACDAAWQRHLDDKHGGSALSPQPRVYIPLSIAGGALGALVGSATSQDDTTNINNAMLFGGSAMTLGALVDTRRLSAPGAAILAGIGAATATVGRGRTLEARGEREPAQTMKEAAIVGSTAAVLTFGLDAITPKLGQGLRFPSGLRIAGGPRNLWVRWVW